MIVFLAGLALTQSTGMPAGAAAISAAGGEIRASQIAAVPARRDAVVARLPDAAGAVTLSEAARLALIRNRYPGANYELRQKGALRVLRERQDPAAAEAPTCFAARAEIAAGAYLVSDDLAPAYCRRAAVGRLLGYDAAAGSFFARQTIASGTFLGRVAARAAPAAIAGRDMVRRTSEGPVTVERKVVALQSARAGREVFVRTEEGEVLAAAVAREGAQ